MQLETAGDPNSWAEMGAQQSPSSRVQRLQQAGHPASPPTASRLLRKLGYSLRVNVKKLEDSAAHPDHEPQFEVLESQKQVFQVAGWPIISVDTKMKELSGNAQKRRASLGSGRSGGQRA